MLKIIKTKIKNWKNARTLRKSNWGRSYGWHIEFKGEIIGELVDCQFSDMFWDSYTIISKGKKWDAHVFDKKHWIELAFTLKNKHYNACATYAVVSERSDIENRKEIIVRGLYITE